MKTDKVARFVLYLDGSHLLKKVIVHLLNKEERSVMWPQKLFDTFPLNHACKDYFYQQRLAEDMRWHAMHDKNDGLMRHPRDSQAWKKFDEPHTSFAFALHEMYDYGEATWF
ncbi:hypothetical protein K1719_047046 [Acacia pycnantha]|nr:hypothetical protein K1719_047046 [Acacia pycnantha]